MIKVQGLPVIRTTIVPGVTVSINLSSTQNGEGTCLGDVLVFRCTVTRHGLLEWYLGTVRVRLFTVQDEPGSEPGPGSLPDVANITLVNVDKDPTHPLLGNLTSDLAVVVSNDNIGKYVNCSNGLNNEQILIKKQLVPLPIIMKENITGGIGEYSFRLQLQAQKRLYSLNLYNDDTLVMNFTAEAGCRVPPSPVNGSIEEYRSTEEGAEIQFHCHDGYTPNERMSSQCLNSSWSPQPMDLVCVLPDPDDVTPDPDDITSDPNKKNCSLRDLSPSLVEENRVCGSVSGGGVCYSGDSVGSVAVYFCDDGYSLEGDTTRECQSSGLWNGTTPQCVEREVAELDDVSKTTAIVIGVVCSLMFLTIGVLLGMVGLYLIHRVRGMMSRPHLLLSPSPPSTSHL
ncbi:hypothetical protein GBAR_LOCUS13694 [Geodia barretti]|uniref:Sushi domain-containing protein n=1 Tax=Geodia barretti TaxID=519541 RepID=A0AA35WJ68_GEOBA|nr:hypothetical protein GBAR_LOCUS13694 [Geodia barretti]